MAGRHRNKGVISRIMPMEDMPFTADGRPVDLVLNPLGVPSRMNIGQLLEVTLGWAAKGLGDKITEYLEQYKPDNIRKLLKEIYPDKAVQDFLGKASDEEVIKMSRHMKDGVHFASPVFDGAAEIDIEKMLKLADLPLFGKTTLYDGVSGEPFAEEVTSS